MKDDLLQIMNKQQNTISKKFTITEEIFRCFEQAVDCEWIETTAHDSVIKAYFSLDKLFAVEVHYDNDYVSSVHIEDKNGHMLAIVSFIQSSDNTFISKINIDFKATNKIICEYISDLSDYIITKSFDSDEETKND